MKYNIISLIKVRNEQSIILDTLIYLSKLSDGIVILDDKSTDNTLRIIKKYKKILNILKIIEIKKWSKKNRSLLETVHRQILLNNGRKYKPKWFIYHDADERIENPENLKSFLLKNINSYFDGIKINLFDAYITKNDYKPIRMNNNLINFRKYFGPEIRKIVMIFKNKSYINFKGIDSRESAGMKKIIETNFYCQIMVKLYLLMSGKIHVIIILNTFHNILKNGKKEKEKLFIYNQILKIHYLNGIR